MFSCLLMWIGTKCFVVINVTSHTATYHLLNGYCYYTGQLNIMLCFWSFRCDFNKYTLQYIAKLGEIRSAVSVGEHMDMDTDTEPVSYLVKQCDFGDISYRPIPELQRSELVYWGHRKKSCGSVPSTASVSSYTSLSSILPCIPLQSSGHSAHMAVGSDNCHSTKHFALVNVSGSWMAVQKWVETGSLKCYHHHHPWDFFLLLQCSQVSGVTEWAVWHCVNHVWSTSS